MTLENKSPRAHAVNADRPAIASSNAFADVRKYQFLYEIRFV